MATRYLYIARHGEADALGELTENGCEQARLLGQRLSHLPIATVWHSPTPRAAASAFELSPYLKAGTPVKESAELIDHVPYVPPPAEVPEPWGPFFNGYDAEEAAAGYKIAESLTARFATAPDASQQNDIHELLITHAYPIAWLIRHAIDAPKSRWLSLTSANTALTVIEFYPRQPPIIAMFNDMRHLPAELRWTGFSAGNRV